MGSFNMSRSDWLLSALLIAFILACLPSVTQRGMWTDEAYSMLTLSGGFWIEYPTEVTHAGIVGEFLHQPASVGKTMSTILEEDVHPPMYFMAARLWTPIFGQTLESLRILSVVMGVLSIVFFYAFMRTLLPEAAIYGSAVFSFSTAVLHYSTEARLYIGSLLALMLLLYIFALQLKHRELSESVSGKLILSSAIASVLLFLFNYLAVFPLIAVYAWVFCVRRLRWAGFLSGLLASVLVLIWLPFFIGNHLEARADQASGWEGLSVDFAQAARAVLGSLYVASSESYPTLLQYMGRLFLVGLAILGAVYGLFLDRRVRELRLVILFGALAAAPGGGIILLNFLTDKHLEEFRYYMLSAPGLAGLCGLGIYSLKRFGTKAQTAVASVAMILLLSVANWGYSTSLYQGKTVYRDLAVLVDKSDAVDNLIIAGTGGGPGNTAALLNELPPETNVLVLSQDSDVDEVLKSVDANTRIWLVRVRAATEPIEDLVAARLRESRGPPEIFHQIEIYR